MNYDIKPHILSPRYSLPKVECFAKLGKKLFSLLVQLTVQRTVTRNPNFSYSRMIHVTSEKMSVLDFKYKVAAQNIEVVQNI